MLKFVSISNSVLYCYCVTNHFYTAKYIRHNGNIILSRHEYGIQNFEFDKNVFGLELPLLS